MQRRFEVLEKMKQDAFLQTWTNNSDSGLLRSTERHDLMAELSNEALRDLAHARDEEKQVHVAKAQKKLEPFNCKRDIVRTHLVSHGKDSQSATKNQRAPHKA